MSKSDKEIVREGGREFIRVSKCHYAPRQWKSGKHFFYSRCRECGKLISNCGFASYNHDQMHKRNAASRILNEKGEK